MANFINYRNLDFKLNSQNFYATQISLSAQASVEPVLLSDGSLLNYAPQGALVGSLQCEFYLTGSLPSFLTVTNNDESAITAKFAGVDITGVYPKSISFNVEPFQPVLISTEFDWYGNVKVEDFIEQSVTDRQNKSSPNYIASAYKSYLDTADIFNFAGSAGSDGAAGYLGDSIGNIVSFSYNSTCDRPAFYNVDEILPFRVGKLNKANRVELKSNYLGKLISINGKTAATTIYLKDFYGTSLQSFSISGFVGSQNYEVSEGQYLLNSATIDQTIPRIKTLV
jgi:hypothetical protein